MTPGRTLLRSCVLYLLWLQCLQGQPNGFFNAAPPGQAPALVATGNDYTSTPSGAPALILRTDVQFRLITANGFAPDAQLTFSNALRQVLAAYNFMSISITAFQSGSGFVDVTCRLVNFPNDGVRLSDTWHSIAGSAVNNTLIPAMATQLVSSGTASSIELLSAVGAADKTQPQVALQLNVTLGQLSGFTASQQSGLVNIFLQLLADHATGVDLTAFKAQPASTSVAAVLDIVMWPDQLPGLWFFLLNTTAQQPALAQNSLAGVQLRVDNCSVTAEIPTPPAPVVAPPPGAQLQAPPPAASASAATLTQGLGVPYIILNLSLRVFGESIIPFDSTVQYTVAQALAAVFSIIVGNGDVQMLSSMPAPAGSQPVPYTGNIAGSRRLLAHGASIHGSMPMRVLLQAQAPAPAPAASTPAVDVVFAVTLPQAAQNSLLVLQSSSLQVQAQFAGWFVYAMSAYKYAVQADLLDVTISYTSPAPPPSQPSIPGGSASPPVGAQAASRGGSSHVGAIVGGVVGGVAGLVLLGCLGLFALYLYKRDKGKHAAGNVGGMRTGSNNSLASKDVLAPKSSRFTNLMDTPPTHAAIASVPTERRYPGPTHSEEVQRILSSRSRRTGASSLTTPASETAHSLLARLPLLLPNSLYQDKYVLEAEQHTGNHSLIRHAHLRSDPATQVVIKFYPDASIGRFRHENLFYDNRAAIEPETADTYVPARLDAFKGSSSLMTEQTVPSALVLARGEFTLLTWLADGGHGKSPENTDRLLTLYDISKAVEFLHVRSLVHGGLEPSSFLWFSAQGRWKVGSLGSWARAGERTTLSESNVRYAAPEILHAELQGDTGMLATETLDLWSLGVLAFELLAGSPLFPSTVSDEQLISMHLGLMQYPWEQHANFYDNLVSDLERRFIQDLLLRKPSARKPIRTVVHSPVFGTFNFSQGPLSTRSNSVMDIDLDLNSQSFTNELHSRSFARD